MNLKDTIYFGCAAYSSIHPHRAAELNHLFCTNGNGYEWDENGQLVECCGETTFKNGKRRSLASAITNVFKRRKRDADYRKKWEAKRKRDEKKHPEKLQALISDSKLDELVNDALKAMQEAKAKDPKGFAERQEQLKEEIAASRKQWKESKRWEYRIPTDIKARTEFREPGVGSWEGYNHWYPMHEGYCKMLTYDPATIADDFLDGIIETCNLIICNPPAIRARMPHDPDGTYSAKEREKTVDLAKKALAKATNLKVDRHFAKVKRNFPRTFKGVESI